MFRKLTPLLLFLLVGLVAGATSQPAAPEGTVAALWRRMVEINERGQKIEGLSAAFEQKKFTAMLKKPLVSTGTVRVSKNAMRWDTVRPEPTVMLVDEREVRLLFPKQKTLEVYPIDQKLGSLAASPLPRLEVLRQYFSFKQIPAKELDDQSEDGKLALELTPIEASIKEHVERVRVLLDASKGYIVRAEMVDSDGDRTVISFNDVVVKDQGELKLDVAGDVKVVRPLDALQGK
ncbi:MAG TPA: outer membrane lipoprotein carrier protein LolA [Tepidisphaeraceae bacterium]|jgi:outer membrane lipoprotein-sorting protein